MKRRKHSARSKNEQIFSLASKSTKTLLADLKHWLEDVTEQNNKTLRQARDSNDACPAVEQKSHTSVGTVNEKASKRSSISTKSKTSFQNQKELVLVMQRWEELERQIANALRLVKQRDEFALKRLEEEQVLQLQKMAEENLRKTAEARITKLGLTEKHSEALDELHETLSRFSKHSRQTASQRVSDWLDDVNTEPPETETSITVAVSPNPPIATTTEVVQSGYPNHHAALTSELNNLPSAQQPNFKDVNSNRPVIANSSPPSVVAVSQLSSMQMPSAVDTTRPTTKPPAFQTRSVPPQTQQSVNPMTMPPLISISSSHAVPNLSA